MGQAPRNPWLRLGVVLGATAMATLLRWLLRPWLGDGAPFLLFIPAIILASWVGGVVDGLATTILGLLIARFVLVQKLGAAGVPPHPVALYAMFGLIGACIVGLVDRIDRSRRRAEAMQGRLHQILESIADSYLSIDREWRIREVNREAEGVFGKARAQLVGTKMWEEYPQAVDSEFYRQYHRAMAEQVPVHFEAESKITPCWFEAHAYPSPDGLSIYLRDITDRKRAEAELHAARDAAEAANRAKDQFLAMLSHELRNPLNPVLLATTAALNDPATPPGLRADLEMIRQNVQLEARLIDDLLDVMRVIRGKMHYQWEAADAHDLLGRTFEICRADWEAKRIALDIDLAAREPWVRADPARLQQVFWNLLKNAIKFTPEGGAVTLRTAAADDGRFVLELRDSGIGIDADDLGRIFNAFEQAEDPATRRPGGLGLGLAISRSIVEAHGGTLAARSPGRGQGATFELTLPTTTPDAGGRRAEPTVACNGSDHRPYRLLLIEDDAATSRVLARLLRGAGHTVTAARNVVEALAAASADLDLVVADIGLPDGSGLDLMRRLRREHGLWGIALTGYGTEEDIARSREAGFADHITKPVEFRRLAEAILRVGSLPRGA